MNIDDLRGQLASSAERAESIGPAARMTGVRTRARDQRRRAVVTGAVSFSAAAAVTAVVAVPQLLDSHAGPTPTTPAPATRSTQPPTPLAPLAFPPLINGDQLLTSRLNRPGTSTLRLRTSVANLDILSSLFCSAPRDYHPAAVRDAQLMITLAVNGTDLYGRSCSVGAQPGENGTTRFGFDSAANVSVWRDAGARPGEPFTVIARLELRGTPVSVPDARFGMALYATTGERVSEHGVTLPAVLEGTSPGRFELVDYLIRPVSDGRQLSLRIPSSDASTKVSYGWDKVGTGGRLNAWIDGSPTGGSEGGGVLTDALDSSRSHVVSIQVRGGKPRGALVIAYYRETG